MSKNKKPRKKHRPLAYHVNPLAMLADHSRAQLSMSQIRDLFITVHSSLMAIEQGKGREEDIVQLAVGSNITLIFAEAGLGREHIPEVKEAQRRIVKLQKQWKDRGTAILSGPGMLAIREMLALHDEQMQHELCTETSMRKAMKIIHARMAAGNVELPE